MSDSSCVISTTELWPLLAEIFGLDKQGKCITKFELIVEAGIPVVRIEMVVGTGQAMSLTKVFEEFALVRKPASRCKQKKED